MALPRQEARPWHLSPERSSGGQEDLLIFLAAYNSEADARSDYDLIRDLHAEGAVGTYDAAVVTNNAEGKVHVSKDELPTRHGAWTGIAAGAVLGIVFPPSIIGSAAVGGVAGGVIGHLWRGMSRRDVAELGDALDSGQAALIVVGEDKVSEQIRKAQLKAVKQVEKQIDADAEELKSQLERPPGRWPDVRPAAGVPELRRPGRRHRRPRPGPQRSARTQVPDGTRLRRSHPRVAPALPRAPRHLSARHGGCRRSGGGHGVARGHQPHRRGQRAGPDGDGDHPPHGSRLGRAPQPRRHPRLLRARCLFRGAGCRATSSCSSSARPSPASSCGPSWESSACSAPPSPNPDSRTSTRC